MQQSDKQNSILLGLRVKSYREKTGESLNSFVLKRGGLTPATWSRVENGKFDVKFSTLVKIASLLEIKIEELLKDLPLDYTICDD